MLNQTSGLGQIAATVNNNFNVKVYTQEMLEAINNPLADLSKTEEAYQYFTSMLNGQNFVTASGQTISFANLPDTVKTTLHSKVVQVLKDYNTVNVPYDFSGDTTPLLNADGSQASLYDIIANPSASFHVKFSVSDTTDASSSPDWSKNPAGGSMYGDYQNEDSHWYGSTVREGGTDHFQVGDRTKYELDASVSDNGGCGNDAYDANWTISGTATAWEQSGALNPSASNPQTASNDANGLENYLANNM